MICLPNAELRNWFRDDKTALNLFIFCMEVRKQICYFHLNFGYLEGPMSLRNIFAETTFEGLPQQVFLETIFVYKHQ